MWNYMTINVFITQKALYTLHIIHYEPNERHQAKHQNGQRIWTHMSENMKYKWVISISIGTADGNVILTV